MGKTELMLLVMTGGAPVLNLQQLASLRNIQRATLLNQIYSKACPIPVFKDGNEWFAHVSDVAAWIDEQRKQAHGQCEARQLDQAA